ncbi:MAG: hypothetical protein OEZ40_01595 [Candidatus Bathyarchaeota archaeon]|nr:hypothetical protein [Candidatus Bathyarchaeota archaeon]
MALTDTKSEKVPGRITHVYIGKSSTVGLDISSGIVSFDYRRNHDATRYNYPGRATAPDIFQHPSTFSWELKFLSDCRAAFFDTDVTAVADQKALDDDGISYPITWFKVIVPIIDKAGATKTRTYTITGGYVLRNSAYIGDDEDAVYVYEGDAEYISYADT